MALAAIEKTTFGKIYKYGNVRLSAFSDVCMNFEDKKYFLNYIAKNHNHVYDRIQNLVGNRPPEALSQDEIKKIAEMEELLGGLKMAHRRARREMKYERKPVIVCFSEEKWVTAHEKMHGLMYLSSKLAQYELRRYPAKREVFHQAAFRVLRNLGPGGDAFVEYVGPMLWQQDRHEILTGVVGISVLVRDKRTDEKEIEQKFNDAINAFVSYFDPYVVGEERRDADGALKNEFLRSILKLMKPMLKEFGSKYGGNLEKVAADFGKIYAEGLHARRLR